MASNKNSAPLGLLVLRVVTGIIFIMHGWQKFSDGIPATADGFTAMGIPAPSVTAPFIAGLELIGGAALVIGLLSRPIAVLLVIDMIGALVTVHAPQGFFAGKGGYEYVLALAAICATLALTGPGKFALDGLLFGRSKRLKAVLA
ncbi:DoxX family protein [Renibacterium salmoninarum]|nr:DoxX family protein [Renibacterium salmoninarum]